MNQDKKSTLNSQSYGILQTDSFASGISTQKTLFWRNNNEMKEIIK